MECSDAKLKGSILKKKKMLIERSAERVRGMFLIPNFGWKADRLHSIILQARLRDWTGGPEFSSTSSRARSDITKAEPRLSRALPALQKQYGSNVNFSSFWFVPVCAVNKVTLKGWSHYYLCEWFMICTLEISNFHAKKRLLIFHPLSFFSSLFLTDQVLQTCAHSGSLNGNLNLDRAS